jgi:hypothetical protein
VFFGLVFLLVAMGTIWSLTEDGYQWAAGELATEIVILVVSLVLSVYTGLRARSFGRQAKALQPVTWLPPAAVDDDNSELAVHILRLRTVSRRIVASCAGWVGVLLLGAGAFVLLADNGRDLLDRGTKVTGTVVTVHHARRGSDSMTVRYWRGQVERTDTIFRNSDREYIPGQYVTVVYDLADPDLVRTVDERNDNQLVTWAAWGLIVVGCIGLPMAVLAAARWRERYLAVRTTGWRSGRADIIRLGRKEMPTMKVEFRDASTISLKADSAFRAPTPVGEVTGVPVWVGGEGRYMVMLMQRQDRSLRAVPVKAEGALRRVKGRSRPVRDSSSVTERDGFGPETKRHRMRRRKRGVGTEHSA